MTAFFDAAYGPPDRPDLVLVDFFGHPVQVHRKVAAPLERVIARLKTSAEIWKNGGFNVKTYDDVERMIWEKFICNVTFSASTALTGLTIGGVINDPHAWQLASACATEAWQVAKAKNIAVAIDEPVSFVRDFGGKIPNARPSMSLDHMAKRRCEIDVINGAVPVQAASVGLQAPVNATLSALIRQREAAFT